MAEQVKPNYVATKSAWKAITFWRVVFFWLIIPLIIMIVKIIVLKHERFEFYEDKIIVKSGVLNKKERKTSFIGINSVSIEQSLAGRIFNYGDLRVDAVGKWDVNTLGVKQPKKVMAYLETKIVKKESVTIVSNEH